MFSYLEASRSLGIHLQNVNPTCYATGASIDTRTLEIGDLFIALKGERTDGHLHLQEAFRKGASGALVQRDYAKAHFRELKNGPPPAQNLLIVDDTQQSLLELASWYRDRFKISVIGITGSVGKTSTKEFLKYLLSKKYPTLASEGNKNNHLGLPLTLLRLQHSDRYCIAELGANHAGEIRALSRILKPTAAVITKISPAHLEGFGSLEAIYGAKLEIADFLIPEAPFVIPSEDTALFERARQKGGGFRTIRVGTSEEADWRLSEIKLEEGMVSFRLNKKRKFRFPSSARFMARNAAMAIAMADSVGFSYQEIPGTWKDFQAPCGRFEVFKLENGLGLIHDGYNANPDSYEKAFEAFQELPVPPGTKKILVIGDMLELGKDEEYYHRQLGEKLSHYLFDTVFGFGPRMRTTIQALAASPSFISTRHFAFLEDVFDALKDILHQGDVILLKGSRGVHVENIIDSLKSLKVLKLSASEP